MKCEWCEEGRYTSIGNQANRKKLYCLDLAKDDKGYKMEVLEQTPPNVVWKLNHIKYINYCPFCGRQLDSKEE